jgi:hypothetical protein
MAMSEEQFKALNPEDRKKVLGEMRLEKEFKSLPSEDRKQINTLLKASKEEKMSETEAVARGGAQGLAFGFADEIAAGLTAAGQKFLGNEDFQPAFDKALKAQRDRDKLAQAKFPKLFATGEVSGAVATSLIPIVGVAGKSAQAAKGLATATKALTKSREGLRLSKKFATGIPAAKESVISAIKGVRQAKEVVSKSPALGKGLARGAAGAGKATVGGAVTGLGKSEDKRLEDATKGALIGGIAGIGASALGPIVRGLAKTTIKSPAIASAIASGGKSEALKVVFNKVKKGISTNEAVKLRIDSISKALKSPKNKITKAGEKFLDTLGEAFEKQGGAGLVTTHVSLLKDPGYVEFLDKIEKQRGLTVPKKKEN